MRATHRAWPSAPAPGPTRLVLALLICLAAGILPPDAAAHQRLVRSEPARDASLDVAPRELRLAFAEPVALAFTRLQLTGPDGRPVALGPLSVAPDDARVLVAPIEGPLEAGSHLVAWSTASRDGHPVRGELGFTISAAAQGLAPLPSPDTLTAARAGEGPQGDTPPAPAAPATPFSAESAGYVVVRWVNYIALLGVLGAAVFGLLVIGRLQRTHPADDGALAADARRLTAAVGLGFVALLLLMALARLFAQSLALHGAEEALAPARLRVLLESTPWGWGWLIQLVGAGLAGAGFALARSGRTGGWALVALAALALPFTTALSGHAAAVPGTLGIVAVAADALHVLAAGGWLGALLVLLLAGLPVALRQGDARRSAAAALVGSFSPVALTFAALLFLTGIAATLIHAGSLGALLASRYGAVLMVKLGLVAVVLAIGAFNFLRVRPSLADGASTDRLRRSAGLELTVAAAILLVTAVLVATAPPPDPLPADAAAAEPRPRSAA